jgi:uncharacterized protein
MKESRYNLWVEDDGMRHVYNTLSGAHISMHPDQWAAIEHFLAGQDDVAVDSGLLHELVTGRAIVNDDTDELDVLRRRYELGRRNSDRFHLTVVTSLGCNFNCPYCFEAKHPSLLDEPVQEQLLRLVQAKLGSVQKFSVLWFGGEPLVGKAALLRLSDEFIRRSAAARVTYDATITTNGYLLTEATARELRERHVRSAQITIDGPEEIHDHRRPLIGGRGTFRTILANVVAVADILSVKIRVNIDAENVSSYERLLQTLASHGLAGRVAVSPGHTIAKASNSRAPSATYDGGCLTRPAFADVKREFYAAAARLGFATDEPPGPTGAPCTAVRDNELVVGSRGELYKCPQTVGDPSEVIGNLLAWPQSDNRLLKWLEYDPFADDDCRSCRVLPTCMGGCAHYAMDVKTNEVRCSTFRFTHEAEIRKHIRGRDSSAPASSTAVPIKLSSTRLRADHS